jgi:competence ComEA-like helix-hairpin-helix protein
MNVRVLHLIVLAAMTLASLPSQAQTVDVNTATQAEFEALPGIGPKLASEIVREREENGPFASVDDLARVPSMTTSVLAKIKSQLRFSGAGGLGSRPRQETLVVQEGKVVSGDIVKKVLQRYAVEPTAREVQQQAIEYMRVHPEVVDSWRLRARTNALAPRLTTAVQGDINDDRRTIERPGDPTIVSLDNDQSGRLVVGATWELDRLIFEPAEMAVARESVRIANLRDRVLDEVTRRYFERRRLQVDLELSPPKDLADRVRKELRLQELTADIDAATGGWFSEKLKTTGQTPY